MIEASALLGAGILIACILVAALDAVSGDSEPSQTEAYWSDQPPMTTFEIAARRRAEMREGWEL